MMFSSLDADRFGFDWPAHEREDGYERDPGCHIQVTRTCSIRWKGRDYRYVAVRTPSDMVEVRVAPGGSIRVLRGGKELGGRRG